MVNTNRQIESSANNRDAKYDYGVSDISSTHSTLEAFAGGSTQSEVDFHMSEVASNASSLDTQCAVANAPCSTTSRATHAAQARIQILIAWRQKF